MAGQAAVEFADDSPAVTGVLGTVIHDNWAYRLSERKRLAGSVAPGYLTLCQGEADRNLAPGAWHCKTDQIDLAEFYAGVLMCPMHPFPIGADGVHFLWQDSYRIADTGAWALAEIEAGRNWPALRPSAQRDGHVVTLRYALRHDEQLRRLADRYPALGLRGQRRDDHRRPADRRLRPPPDMQRTADRHPLCAAAAEHHRPGLVRASRRGRHHPDRAQHPVPGRDPDPRRATILFAGHSFVQTAYGTPLSAGTPEAFGGILQTDWPGTALSDFVSFGSMRQVWELDDDLRHGAYDVAIVSVVSFDFANGFPAVDSYATRTTLQHLYWAGLTAQARGAEIILQDVWSPLGRARGDGGIDGTFFFMANRTTDSRGIVSVKAGRNLNPGMVRDLVGTLGREPARAADPVAIAVMICAHEPTEGMRREALEAGTVETAIGAVPAVQLLFIREILEGRTVRVPLMHDSLSAASMGRRKERARGDHIPPEDLFRQRSLLLSFTGGKQPRGRAEKVLPERIRGAG